eukprot:CAMPEP_0184696708 /NCGR_PEP_ID=MMETSP0313-20130426/3926_1 /TAXON_ID=2792 /ORGANISM="Porphyridium aerugineum, Strain SAG 1380-2" /LENGTH=559 /DNA_ID=CAMNT_0027155395 /DNA_START=313 /DNA_END=1989 /DNA_ORIENTATION=+
MKATTTASNKPAGIRGMFQKSDSGTDAYDANVGTAGTVEMSKELASTVSPRNTKQSMPVTRTSGSLKMFVKSFSNKSEEEEKQPDSFDEKFFGNGEDIVRPPKPQAQTSIRGEAKSYTNAYQRHENSTEQAVAASLPVAFPDRRASETPGLGRGFSRNTSMASGLTTTQGPSLAQSTTFVFVEKKAEYLVQFPDVGTITEALSTERGNEERMVLACQAIHALYTSSDDVENLRADFIKANGLENLVRLIRMYPENITIQEQGMSCLILIGAGDYFAQGRIARAGAVDVILNCLSTEATDVGMQDRAICTLANLILLPCNQKEVTRSKGLASVISVMNAFAHVGSIQAEGCSFLTNYSHDPDGKAEVLSAGGLDCILECLKVHVENPFVSIRACIALRNIAFRSKPAQIACWKKNSFETIIENIQEQIMSPVLIEHAFMALYNIIWGDGAPISNWQNAFNGGTIVSVMRKHYSVESIQKIGIALIALYVESDKGAKDIIEHRDGLPTIIYVLENYDNSPEVVRRCAKIFKLCSSINARSVQKVFLYYPNGVKALATSLLS